MEQLYLFEFLVDNVSLHKDPMQADAKPGSIVFPLQVKIKFLELPYFQIQSDFRIQQDKGQVTPSYFSNGKSCLFAKQPIDLMRSIEHTPLFITVYRGLCPNKEPKILGQTKIKFAKDMVNAIRDCMFSPDLCPVSKILKDKYPLTDCKDKESGSILLFIRLSCVGRTILTTFKLKDEDRANLFPRDRAGEASCGCAEDEKNREKADDDEDCDEKYKFEYDIIPVKPLTCSEEGENRTVQLTATIYKEEESKRFPIPWLAQETCPPCPDEPPKNTIVGEPPKDPLISGTGKFEEIEPIIKDEDKPVPSAQRMCDY